MLPVNRESETDRGQLVIDAAKGMEDVRHARQCMLMAKPKLRFFLGQLAINVNRFLAGAESFLRAILGEKAGGDLIEGTR